MMTDGKKLDFIVCELKLSIEDIDASPSITSAQWIIELLGTHP